MSERTILLAIMGLLAVALAGIAGHVYIVGMGKESDLLTVVSTCVGIIGGWIVGKATNSREGGP